MAARRKSTRKAPARRKAARKRPARRTTKKRTAAAAQELPARLRDFTKEVRSLLGSLEKEVVKAQASYRRSAARLLREASVELGKFETRGEREWRKLNTTARRNALSMLRRLEKVVGSGKGKKGSRRKSGATKAARRATRGAQHALRQAASQVAPRKRRRKK